MTRPARLPPAAHLADGAVAIVRCQPQVLRELFASELFAI